MKTQQAMSLGDLLRMFLNTPLEVGILTRPSAKRGSRSKAVARRAVRGKLTASQVREIRAGDPGKDSGQRWAYYQKAARRFGVTSATISHVVTRRTWKKVRATRKVG